MYELQQTIQAKKPVTRSRGVPTKRRVTQCNTVLNLMFDVEFVETLEDLTGDKYLVQRILRLKFMIL